ncbi:MAG TPA: hypothetical protein VG651_24045 [Stellaceae bacterium]|nr:hypothetical protein [Stellaceae bacterium]
MEIGQIAVDVAAAAAALPEIEHELNRLAVELRQAQTARNAALYNCAAEAVRDYIVTGPYGAALRTACECEGVLRGLEAELRGRQEVAAIQAGGVIFDLLRQVAKEAVVRPDPAPGRRLLAQLDADPDAGFCIANPDAELRV